MGRFACLMKQHFLKSFGLVALLATLACRPSFAADSPQFRGPNRDGLFPETGLLKTWPEEGPPVTWTAQGIGGGFSSAIIVGGKVYVTGMLGDDAGNLFVLDEAAGTILNTFPYGPETLDEQAQGPRSTPTFDNGKLYFLSGLGVIYCMNAADGSILWSVDTVERFGARQITWDYSESLLVDGDQVLCTPGGPEALVAALDKNSGKTMWTTTGLDDTTSYCSPIIVNHAGGRMLLNATGKHIVGVDPDSGALRWSFYHKANYDIHGVTPVYLNGLVYYTAGDGIGGGALEIAPDGGSVTSKWTDTTLDALHSGVVLIDGHLYGTGYKSGGKLVCLEMTTGKIVWDTRDVREGALIAADGMLYIYEGPRKGVVNLVKASPDGFERTGRFSVTQGTGKHWAHPTLANGKLYIRHGDTLIAYDMAVQ